MVDGRMVAQGQTIAMAAPRDEPQQHPKIEIDAVVAMASNVT